jgi:hypothetical protein
VPVVVVVVVAPVLAVETPTPPPAVVVVVPPVEGVVDRSVVEVELVVEVVPLDGVVDGVTLFATTGCAAMFGTLLGTWSASWTPPQAATDNAATPLSVSATALRDRSRPARVLTPPGPCAGRTSGSR